MKYFTERMRTQLGYLNFYFNKLFTVEGTRYHVSVTDAQKKLHIFQLYKENKSWKILNKNDCPFWITELEPEFNILISKFTKMKED